MSELETIILSLEKSLLRPEVRNSAEKLAELLSESFYEFGSSGNIYYYRKGDVFEVSPIQENDWEIVDFSLLPHGEDSVLATYKGIKHTEPDETKKITLRCSLWEKESGSWKIKFHQGAVMEAVCELPQAKPRT